MLCIKTAKEILYVLISDDLNNDILNNKTMYEIQKDKIKLQRFITLSEGLELIDDTEMINNELKNDCHIIKKYFKNLKIILDLNELHNGLFNKVHEYFKYLEYKDESKTIM